MATIPVDASSTTISIYLRRDATAEPNETFSLRLTNPSTNVILEQTSVQGKILNDDVSNVSAATTIVGIGQITLSWTNPDSNLFAGVTIATSDTTTPAKNCSSGTTSDVGKATSRNITNLTTGSTYSFRICARSISGSISGGIELTNLTPRKADNDGDGLIEITNATQLNNIRYNLAGTGYKTSEGAGIGLTTGCPNNTCRGYELTENIDLSSFNDGTWDPIGSNSDNDRFTAIFDGTGNTISNLRIIGTNNYVGLFSSMENATIRNLELANVAIAGGNNVGALVGDATNSTLSNIELIGGSITANNDNVGGLVGDFRSGTITDSTSSLTIRGGNNTGGLVGDLQGGSIKNSNSSGSVSASNGSDRVGGLVGQAANDTTIDNSWASGNVSNAGGRSDSYGGLVGQNAGAISNSYASGTTGTGIGPDNYFYGGLVGRNVLGTISNSWASGNVSLGNNSDEAGGLVGQNTGAISNSWARGQLNELEFYSLGGLVGNNASGTISNSWASGSIHSTAGISFGGLVGNNFNGNVKGRNYQLDDSPGRSVRNSFVLGDGVGNDATGLRALEMLSGASGDTEEMDSNWHAGFDGADTDTEIDLKTRYCDTNKNGMIDGDEQMANNSVWVIEGPALANNLPLPPTTNEAGVAATYYQIPAIRCIGNTAGITDQTEIDAMRKIEIDRQRRLFAK